MVWTFRSGGGSPISGQLRLAQKTIYAGPLLSGQPVPGFLRA